MRAGQLRVFDGLRITTEHFEHFQNAIHIALRDLRFIAGLGKIHSGFEVERVSETTLKVRPGFAFDFQSNQIVNDEAQSVDISFGPSQETLYLCIQYDQVPTNPIEDRPTLIWDSCKVGLRPDLPSHADNQIAIVRLDKQPESAPNAFTLTSLVDGSVVPPKNETGANQVYVPLIGTIDVERQINTSTLSDKLTEILARSSLDVPIGSAERTLLVLGEPFLAIPFRPASLTLHLIVTGEFVLPLFSSAEINVSGSEQPPATQNVSVQITAHGEAIFNKAVEQHSVSTTEVICRTLAGQKVHNAADINDAGIAEFYFGRLAEVSDSAVMNVLRHILFRIAFEIGDDSSPRLSCRLIWDDELSPTMRDALESSNVDITWNLKALWKASNCR